MDFKDYYNVLGVDRKADAKTIRKAYRRLARESHPDVNKKPGSEERFKEINEAYQVLGDPQKRARYDQMHEAYQRGGVNWENLVGRSGVYEHAPGGFTVTFGDAEGLEDLLGGAGFSEFFQQFFGGADRARGAQGGRGGRGRRGRGPMTAEDLLRDAGASRDTPAESTLEITLEEAYRGDRKAISLQANGQTKRLDVTIPKGVKSGQRIRLPGALDGGDLYLMIRVQPHPVFERHGDDLLVELPVTLPEAMLGAGVEAPIMGGTVTVTVPPETQNGRTLRLRGLGMPRPDGTSGDQLVRIKVVLPQDLTAEERRFFEEMGRRREDTPRAARKE